MHAPATSLTLDAVLLDLGNVLVLHDNALLFRRFGEAAGLGEEEVLHRLDGAFWDGVNRGTLAGAGLRQALRARLGLTMSDADLDALFCSHFTVNEPMLPLVEALVGRVRLVLVSNTTAVHFDYLRDKLPVLSRFDALVLSHEVGLAKPDAAIFELALARAGVAPRRAAFFDDLPAYVEAASALGIHGRLFTDAGAFRRDLEALGLEDEERARSWPR